MAGKRAPTNILLEFNDVVQQCTLGFPSLRERRHQGQTGAESSTHPRRSGSVAAIVNLIVHTIQALSATPQMQREIHLEISLDENDHVAFSIRDTGTDIPINHMEQIFDGFFTKKKGGLGKDWPFASQ